MHGASIIRPAGCGPCDSTGLQHRSYAALMTTDVRGGSGWRRVGPAAVWVGVAVAGSFTRPFSVTATVLVAGVAVVVAVRAVRLGTRRMSFTPQVRRAVVVWSTLLAAVLAWELYAWLSQPTLLVPDPAHPSLSTLLSPALEGGPGRYRSTPGAASVRTEFTPSTVRPRRRDRNRCSTLVARKVSAQLRAIMMTATTISAGTVFCSAAPSC